MTEKTFADFRCDQMVALHYLQLREERFLRDKEIRLRKLKNKVRTMPEIDLQGFVSEAEGFKNKSEKRKAKKTQKYLSPRDQKIKKLRSRPLHWQGLEQFQYHQWLV